MASYMRFFTVHWQHQQIASQVPKYNNYFFWGMLLRAKDASSQDYRLCPYKGLKREERHQIVRPSDYSLTAPFCRICRFIIFKMFPTGKTLGRSKALFIGVSDWGVVRIGSSAPLSWEKLGNKDPLALPAQTVKVYGEMLNIFICLLWVKNTQVHESRKKPNHIKKIPQQLVHFIFLCQ